MVWLLLMPLGLFKSMLTKIHGDKHLTEIPKSSVMAPWLNLKFGLRKPK